MRVASPATKLAVLAAAGALTLAACGGSSSSSSSAAKSGPAGAFGTCPPATGTAHAGTMTVAEPPGATPNWIMPITPGANNSVYTAYSFQYEMWRPLYLFVNGVKPVETPSMSLASPPVYSNGDKTVTVHMKSTGSGPTASRSRPRTWCSGSTR